MDPLCQGDRTSLSHDLPTFSFFFFLRLPSHLGVVLRHGPCVSDLQQPPILHVFLVLVFSIPSAAFGSRHIDIQYHYVELHDYLLVDPNFGLLCVRLNGLATFPGIVPDLS